MSFDSFNASPERSVNVNTSTNLGRLKTIYSALDLLKIQSPKKVTCIGVGYDAGMTPESFYSQPYEPYALAGALNAVLGSSLSLIDISEYPLEHVNNNHSVFVFSKELKNPQASSVWNKLVSALGTSPELVRHIHSDLNYCEVDDPSFDVNYAIEHIGMSRLPVPDWFFQKLDTGEISTILGDIRDKLIPNSDIVFCLNVLLHYPADEQQKIIENLASQINLGGTIVADSASQKVGYPLSRERNPLLVADGGWADKKYFQSIGFSLVERPLSRDKNVFFLKKIIV